MTGPEAHRIAALDEIAQKEPFGALVEGVDLVLVRDGDEVFALYGRCLHRGARLADGHVAGEDIVCGVHGWDFRFRSGVSAYDNHEAIATFRCWTEDGDVFVDAAEVRTWAASHPQPYRRDQYQGAYQDDHGTVEEPHTKLIHKLAREGLETVGHHGPSAAMGVPAPQLPGWADIQFVTAQLATLPQLDEAAVGTDLVIGPRAQKPLRLEIPIFVSDMSFGALSEEAKTAPWPRAPRGPAPASVPAKAACCPKSSRPEQSLFLRAGLGPSFGWSSMDLVRRRSRPSTSRAGRARRPARAATCRARR